MAGTHAVMENKYNHVTPGKVVRIIVLIALLLFLAAPLLWQISLAFKGPKDDMYAPLTRQSRTSSMCSIVCRCSSTCATR